MAHPLVEGRVGGLEAIPVIERSALDGHLERDVEQVARLVDERLDELDWS